MADYLLFWFAKTLAEIVVFLLALVVLIAIVFATDKKN